MWCNTVEKSIYTKIACAIPCCSSTLHRPTPPHSFAPYCNFCRFQSSCSRASYVLINAFLAIRSPALALSTQSLLPTPSSDPNTLKTSCTAAMYVTLSCCGWPSAKDRRRLRRRPKIGFQCQLYMLLSPRTACCKDMGTPCTGPRKTSDTFFGVLALCKEPGTVCGQNWYQETISDRYVT